MKLRSRQITESFEQLKIDSSAVGLLERYCSMVLDANLRINLISRGGDQPLEVERQLCLSLAALNPIPRDSRLEWLDIGSGGGFPAIPLAICRPQIRFTLAESIAKKAFFLERTIEALGLPNVIVVHERVGGDHSSGKIRTGHFDIISVKAVAEWDETLKWGSQHLVDGGALLTYKPATPSMEILEILSRFGFELIDDIQIRACPDESNVYLLVLRFSLSTK